MTADTEIRQAYARATEHPTPGPDLGEVLALGRGARRRRTRVRAAGAVLCAAAVVAGAALVVPQLVADDDRSAVTPAAPTPTDFVAGTDVDESLTQVAASHLPALPQPRDVFTSDSEHNGPMPDADFARAEDWQAEYDLPGGGLFRLLVAHPQGGEAYDCPSCEWTDVAGGRTFSQVSQRLDADGTTLWRYFVSFESDTGFMVAVMEDVDAASRAGADTARTFTDAEMLDLAMDPRLTFPAPVG